VHDLTPELFAARREATSPGLLDRAVAWQERWACGFADHVITVTPRWRERLIARGVAPDRVSVTLNVADTRRFTPATSATSAGDDRFRVVYHGTLTERYGVDVLLEAVAALVPDLPQVQLRVLGDGDARPRLLQRADELGLDGHVSFSPGMVDVGEVVGEVRRADVGVVPNRRNAFTDELLPTKLLEYVAVGIPVVASRTPALEDHLDEGMVEFVTAGDPRELADRLLELHRDPERRRQLVRAADAFHRRHGWDTVAAAYVALIERLTIEAEVRR
jgi:glycosyltransferase involved in cell wall biosynthesis